MLETLARLFRYNEWANGEVLQSLRGGAAPEKAVQLLAHIVAAEWLWLERIRGVPQSYPVWPEWKLEEVEQQIAASSAAWLQFLRSCGEPELEREFEYTNSKGMHYRNKVGDAALHVAMHGTYHRGQIAMLVRQHGMEPAYTDFIEGVRSGKVS